MTDREIVHLMMRMTAAHRYEIFRASAAAGLYFGQPRLLEYIIEKNGCTQNELSALLGVSPPSVAVSVGRLERAGLLKREPDKDDRRRNRLSVTEKGQKALARFRAVCIKTDARLFSGFSAEERETLVSYLNRLTDNIAAADFTPEKMREMLEHEQIHSKERNKK